MGDSRYSHGAFCWWDLETTDPEGAKSFYGRLFDWNPEPPAPGSGGYTILQKEGRSTAALFPMQGETLAAGIPPHWNSYLKVDNADAAALKARELSGIVLAEPFDVMDQGRMAVIQDPAGAVFSIWEPKVHQGAEYAGGPGAVCWTELATPNLKEAEQFYGSIFNWEIEDSPMGVANYAIARQGEENRGGMMQMTEEWEGIPPHWMPYFWVEDCRKSTDLARELGAEVKVAPQEIPNVGVFSVLQDPQGAMFSILGPTSEQTDNPDQ